MAVAVTMPKLGLTMTQGKVAKWLVRDGDQVKEGQPLVVVMSKKITYEIESPASGTLRVVTKTMETRQVAETLAFILKPDEAIPESAQTAPSRHMQAAAESWEGTPSPSSHPAGKAARAPRSSPAARRLSRELGVDIAKVQGTGRDGRITEGDVQHFCDRQARVQATPLARRMAEEEGLDLTQVEGTGPDGRVTEDDVLRVLEGTALSVGARQGPPATVMPKVIPLTFMRQAIAEGMMTSLHSTAQLTLTTKTDVTSLASLRDVLGERWDARISYTDLIVKAVAVALREHPILNSTLVGKEIVLHDEVNIGVAVALEDGLLVPIVREADRISVLEIHRAIQDLARRARQNALSVDEVTGGTFTITNLGMYRVDTFTPIINPPEAAILGVGRIAEELALINGQIMPRLTMTLSLTIDHRIVDGAPGAAFLRTLAQFLEHPALIFGAGSALEGEV